MADHDGRDDAELLSATKAFALLVISSVVLAVWCVVLMIRQPAEPRHDPAPLPAPSAK